VRDGVTRDRPSASEGAPTANNTYVERRPAHILVQLMGRRCRRRCGAHDRLALCVGRGLARARAEAAGLPVAVVVAKVERQRSIDVDHLADDI
jgi:hypothetical protein